MQHRQPRLGDIVDDYCPRERRLTNHAVVAMVEADIKQVRCTTCDTEHEYKHAKVPSARKKKEAAPALFKQVLASAQPEALRAAAETEEGDTSVPDNEVDDVRPLAESVPPPVAESHASAEEGVEAPDQEVVSAESPADDPVATEGEDEGPVHRRLIRATLPRPEGGTPAPRPLPQFTVRQPGKFNNANTRGSRPGGGGQGGGRMRAQPQRGGSFGRNQSRENFSGRPSGNPHHGMQRAHSPNRPAGRPLRHGKKSSK